MNKTQKIIISIGLILAGLWTLLFFYYLSTEYGAEDLPTFFLSLLGLAFIVLALVVLFSLKKRR